MIVKTNYEKHAEIDNWPKKVGLQGASKIILSRNSKICARSANIFGNCCPPSLHKLYRTKGMVSMLTIRVLDTFSSV